MEKKASLLFLLFLLCNAVVAQHQRAALRVLEKMIRATAVINTVQYEAEFRQKFFHSDDTMFIKGTAYVRIAPSDSVLGYQAYLSLKGKPDRYYDLHISYEINHCEKKVLWVPGDGVFSTNIAAGLVSKELLRAQNLPIATDRTYTLDKSRETKNHWVICIIYPNEGDYSEMRKWIWANKKTHLPEKTAFRALYTDQFQYTENKLTNIKINNPATAAFLGSVEIPGEYEREEILHTPPMLLAEGSVAPGFNLNNLQGDKVQLSDFKGNYVLLDFWYTGCAPCVKALPKLQQLQDKYADKNLVIMGINPFDKNADKLRSFLQNRSIGYPTLLADTGTIADYAVRLYPTLYLIGPDGTVLYAQAGVNLAQTVTLEQVLERYLK